MSRLGDSRVCWLIASPRKPLLALSVGLRAVFAAALAVSVGVSAPPVVVVVLAFCFTACGTPCYPCLAAAVPSVVPPQDLVPANGILTGVEALAFVAGPGAGAAALVLGSPEAAARGERGRSSASVCSPSRSCAIGASLTAPPRRMTRRRVTR